MKALEKAAKDREGADALRAPATPAPATGPAKSGLERGGLELEPMLVRAPAEPDPVPPTAQPARAAAPRQPAHAAAVISAGRGSSGGIGAFVSERPLAVFGGLAGLVAVAYGVYVFLQITNPGLFTRPPPRPTPIAQVAPPPVQPPPAATTATQPPVALSSLALTEAEAVPSATTAKSPTSGAVAPATASAAATAATKPSAAAGAATTQSSGSSPAAPNAQLPPAAANTADAPREAIRVTAGTTTPVVNPLLSEAYVALNAGNLEASQRLYNQMLRSDPGSVDALLGIAAIATQQGNSDEATGRYLKVLELDPRNALAQAGLIGILGRADPQAAETRVKQLIAREPSAPFLHFALGITYIDQKRWPDAQQAFFQAHYLQPDNPDYAYNLAVALEHIGQPRAALDYYRRALQLATARGRANFSTVTAEDRIGKLEKSVR